jgi:hypothetical protein
MERPTSKNSFSHIDVNNTAVALSSFFKNKKKSKNV